jgi:hypothetical protein
MGRSHSPGYAEPIWTSFSHAFRRQSSALTFTNLDTGAALSMKANGAVSHVTLNPDGSRIQVLKGHNTGRLEW